jgi:hypothetical protein
MSLSTLCYLLALALFLLEIFSVVPGSRVHLVAWAFLTGGVLCVLLPLPLWLR